MAGLVKAGGVLMVEGLRLPESLSCESEPYAQGWRLITSLDSHGLDQIISKAGWTFFYIAGVINASVFGANEEKAIRKAIKEIITHRRSRNFNCLEITQVAAKRFLGLPYVSVSAHSRHIQESRVLLGDQGFMQSSRAALAVI